MTSNAINRALEIIDASSSGDFVGPRPEDLIAAAERFIGVRFPPSFRAFLLRLGCGRIEGLEVYGVVSSDWSLGLPNGIAYTNQLRERIGLAPQYIVVGEGGDGTLVAIDTSHRDANGESPVVRLNAIGQRVESIATDFGQYLLSELEWREREWGL